MRWSKRADELKEAVEEKGAAVAQAARNAAHGDFERARAALHDGGIGLPDSFRETRHLGAGSVGALAIGAFAVGAFAVGAFAIGRLSVGKAKIGKAEIDHLTIGTLEVEHIVPPPLSNLTPGWLRRR
ncbi:hypothetical protein NDN16_17210 [Aureimonas altamirensis]|uniref:hypothetical protein n=1 Tax=Aureimonas altamirensis TaxID=370622 RepID=UPI002036F32B|nr:hypothetical protein [Aureimonas altamirensis]MCM2505410.1 hypothetical protein [Aureimonas altamirensis]